MEHDNPIKHSSNSKKDRLGLDNALLMPAIEWVAEQIPGGFFIYRADDSMEMLYVNSAVLRIFGCRNLEEFKTLTGYTFRGLVHPEDFDTIQASIDKQIADETNENLDYVEYRIIRKDGSIRWVDDYGHFAQLPGYGDVYYVFIGDITDKHLAQEEKNRRAMLFAGLMEQFNVVADDSLASIRCNLTTGLIEEVRGRDVYEADQPGHPLEACIHARSDGFLMENDRKRFEELFQAERLEDRLYRDEAHASFVGYCRRQSGKLCFVKFSCTMAKEPVSGDLIAFFMETESTSEKISEVLNEKVLVRQYDMVTYVVGNHYSVVIGDAGKVSRGSILPTQRDGVYMDYIRNQVLPVVDESTQDRDMLEKALCPETIARQLETKDSYTVDVTCRIGGEIYNKRFTYYAVDRTAKFFLLLKSDMTDVLRRERERNEMLADALQEAERANVAKTSFLSNMSHEIRTPMNAIIGLNSIAQKDVTLSDQTRGYLCKIEESARHLLRIINDILDMSRIESGKLTLRKEEFSLTSILTQINTMLQAQCKDKGLTYQFVTKGHPDDWYFGDDMKLKQVLLNILSNSIKFTEPPGGVQFTVEKIAEFNRQTTLRFIIKDDGIGMDETFLPKLFDPFTQENASRGNKYGSTGLGMAITRNIVEMMNGTISVTSQKDVGSEFTVTVTLRNCDKASDDSNSMVPSNLKVLVVDDDPIALEHAAMTLEGLGITADCYSSGEEALQAIEIHQAKHDPYNLVLLDWKMPGMDGVEVTRRIRTLHEDDTTIIILTSYSWDDVMDVAQNAGVDSFMAKPLHPSHVVTEFERAFRKKGQKILPQKGRVELAGRRILLAEDMMINAEIMKELLSMKGMETEHAENGQAALELFRQSEEGHFDAVLMDVRMPVMDGLQAAAAIRALKREDAQRVPIIALTANAFDEDVKRSLQAGMNAHLSKPVEPDHLYTTLEELMKP